MRLRALSAMRCRTWPLVCGRIANSCLQAPNGISVSSVGRRSASVCSAFRPSLLKNSFALTTHRHSSSGKEFAPLKFDIDTYNGVLVKSDCLPEDPEVFKDQLIQHLRSWKIEGRRGIWLPIPKQRAQLIPFALGLGCEYHHAEQDYVMLTHWLADGPNRLPSSATHHVGVGAIVANDKREVLMVQEKTGPLRGKKVWKLPTGMVESGENIKDAAIRELKEETGIDTEFIGLAAFRQAHKVRFNSSDLFFMVALRPLTYTIRPQAEEVEACEWVPLDEYLKQPWYQDRPLYEEMQEVVKAVVEGQYNLFSGEDLESGNRGLNTFYYSRQSLHASKTLLAAQPEEKDVNM